MCEYDILFGAFRNENRRSSISVNGFFLSLATPVIKYINVKNAEKRKQKLRTNL